MLPLALLAMASASAVAADPGRQVPAVDLARLPLADCRRLAGQEVLVYFVIGAPPFTIGDVTVIGVGPLPDRSERYAVFTRTRDDFRVGQRVGVRGVVEVRHQDTEVVNGVEVPAWDVVRVEGAAVVR